MSRYLPTRAAALGILLAGGHLFGPAEAQAQVLEVIHPEIEKGGYEVELLGGVRLDNVPAGEESGVYEFAIGYAPTDHWKFTIAFEIADPRGDTPELEAIEIENLFLFFGAGEHDHDHHAGETGLRSAGLFTVLEIPQNGGIKDGASTTTAPMRWPHST